MKVIDLLNKIANGEEVPQLIKWNGYIYDKLGCEYYMLNDRDITLFGDILDTNGKYLNDEVEIIEEPKKIEYPILHKTAPSETTGDQMPNWRYLIDCNFEHLNKTIYQLIGEVNKLNEKK